MARGRTEVFTAPRAPVFPVSSLTVNGSAVYFANGQGLHALDAASGRTHWSIPVPAQAVTAVDDAVYYSSGPGGAIVALNAADSRQRWERSTATAPVVEIAAAGHSVYAGTGYGDVYALRA